MRRLKKESMVSGSYRHFVEQMASRAAFQALESAIASRDAEVTESSRVRAEGGDPGGEAASPPVLLPYFSLAGTKDRGGGSRPFSSRSITREVRKL
ncbi:hypothetical protein GW17_00035047 [Ensete ventricosum]|nr:hypothetical protein GW17_00035047 [Ensete ventricosum]